MGVCIDGDPTVGGLLSYLPNYSMEFKWAGYYPTG